MSQNYQYNTIEEALRDLKKGKIVLVTDDPDRENEGDLICAAEFATRENINFMATYAKGCLLYTSPSARRSSEGSAHLPAASRTRRRCRPCERELGRAHV